MSNIIRYTYHGSGYPLNLNKSLLYLSSPTQTYNIRNIAIVHIMAANTYNTKQIVTNCYCTHHEHARV